MIMCRGGLLVRISAEALQEKIIQEMQKLAHSRNIEVCKGLILTIRTFHSIHD
jgi:hypothetical protein